MAKGSSSGWIPWIMFGAVAVGAYIFRNEIFGFVDSILGSIGSGGDEGGEFTDDGEIPAEGGGDDGGGGGEAPVPVATTRRDERGGGSSGGSKTRLTKDEQTRQRMITNRNRNTTRERKLREKEARQAQGMMGRVLIG